MIIFFGIALLAGIVLKYTKYGRRIYAVGTNPYAAYLAGINVKNMKLSVYVIIGFLVGIGAVMLLARINTGIITLGQGMEIDTIAMVVIGGTALRGRQGQHPRHHDRGILSGLHRQRNEHAPPAVGSAVRGERSRRDHRRHGGYVSTMISEFISRRKEQRLLKQGIRSREDGLCLQGARKEVEAHGDKGMERESESSKNSLQKERRRTMKRFALLIVCLMLAATMSVCRGQEGHRLLHGRG